MISFIMEINETYNSFWRFELLAGFDLEVWPHPERPLEMNSWIKEVKKLLRIIFLGSKIMP